MKYIKILNLDNEIKFRIICFPFAGGAASFYRNWQSDKYPEIDFCAFQLPGREDRYDEPACTRIEELVPDVVKELESVISHVPFAFFGHSMGALICWEINKYLYECNLKTPDFLFGSSFRAPHLPFIKEKVSHLSYEDFIKNVEKLNGIPKKMLMDNEVMDLILPTLRNDFSLYENYTPTSHNTTLNSIIAFGGDKDPLVSIDELNSWNEVTKSKYKFHCFSGDHYYIKIYKDDIIQTIASYVM